ncbi:E3 ubiquitin-protein ligase RHF1A [Salix suchowensis]|nr:E3 ubiquitin-protein ligase RHF1A [Salix suchowensis]
MTSVINIEGHQSLHSLQDQGVMESKVENSEKACGNHGGICAICLDNIVLQETALVKGCEHAYCVTCILRWSTYSKNPSCPQCKHPFEFLNIHRSLDGSIQDYMFEESVCRLLQASWFMTLPVENHEDVYEDPEEFMTLTTEDHEDVYEDPEDYYPYEFEDGDDDLDEVYLSRSSNLCIGNRRWGDNGYVRAGRQEARPVYQADFKDSGAGSSSEPNKKKEASKDRTGRRAKRTLKREAADKAAAAKHQQHLDRLGRK